MADEKTSVVILDGGSATQLVELGHKTLHEDPLWSAKLIKTCPSDIKLVHKQFYEAGADICITCTYQASVGGYKQHCNIDKDHAIQLMKDSAHLAQEAAKETEAVTGRKCYVAGSVGPYGACLHDGSEYSGNYVESLSIQELSTWHLPRITALAEAGVDFLSIETIPALKEAEAVLETLKHFPNLKVFVNFSCKDGFHTCHGERLTDCIRLVNQSHQVIASGMNCSHPQFTSSLLTSLQVDDITKPIIVKPNSGEDWTQGIGWAGRDKEEYLLSENVDEWIKLGARWIGGCCRLFPPDIAHLRRTLENNKTISLDGPVV
ncbi:homocysteine S-methyltransferase YbgG isoform X1 [Patella vulgata]|uniref:homocysteine S-methyltransferase YbgG isoform X1 n=2 Tax=Patella vulgata TaxID=6465 RepID=UPI0024A9290D|nr:homocysteine S-methyltransferase YbgG isoform X1 [Patella vulgata]